MPTWCHQHDWIETKLAISNKKKFLGGITMKNVGNTDKIIRIILGIAILSLYFILKGNARYFALIGFVPIVTAFVGFCPLYALLGIKTTGKEQTK